LANRLLALTESAGSPECSVTWKKLAMPWGVPLCVLRPSARRSAASACGLSLWPAPQSRDGAQGGQAKRALETGQSGGGRKNLDDHALLTTWPAPAANEYQPRDLEQMEARRQLLKEQSINGNGFGLTLAMLATWANPTAMDGRRGEDQRGQQHEDKHLTAMVGLTSWAAPAERDYRHPNARSYHDRGGGKKGEQLPNQANWAAPTAGQDLTSPPCGTDPNSSTAATASGGACRGVLNPAFSLWVMGYPLIWALCGIRAMASLRSARASRAASACSEVPATQ
jgi:hypothetical protein